MQDMGWNLFSLIAPRADPTAANNCVVLPNEQIIETEKFMRGAAEQFYAGTGQQRRWDNIATVGTYSIAVACTGAAVSFVIGLPVLCLSMGALAGAFLGAVIRHGKQQDFRHSAREAVESVVREQVDPDGTPRRDALPLEIGVVHIINRALTPT